MLRLSRLPSLVRSVPSLSLLPALGHANPHFLDRARVIDPSHPAAKVPLRSLPSFLSPLFSVRAFPNALLQHPLHFVPINPLLVRKYDHIQPPTRKNTSWAQYDAIRRRAKFAATRQIVDRLAKTGRPTIRLLFHTSKKATSKSSVIRKRLRSKITAAIRLVVDRHADVAASDPSHRLVSLQEHERLILEDWTYVVTPDLTTYKAPLPILVQTARKAFLSLNRQAARLQSSWALPKAKDQTLPVHAPKTAPRKILRPPTLPRTPETPRAPLQPAQPDHISNRLFLRQPIVLPPEKPPFKE